MIQPNPPQAIQVRPHDQMIWTVLLLINALSMLAAGLVLFIWPGWIPAVVGIQLGPDAAFMAYLLGAAELGLATLCFLGMGVRDPSALRLVAWTGAVFHAVSGLAGLLVVHERGGVVLGNIVTRVIMVVLFGAFALSWRPGRSTRR